MKDQKVLGKRKNNPVAAQLSDPMWRKRVVDNKMIYNRKVKHKRKLICG